jgi:large subunit ribosomal protein L23
MSKPAEAKKAPSAKDYNTIVRPVITEKATNVSAHNQVVFQVPLAANKKEIRTAVQNLFNVKVVGVNTSIRKGKTKLFRGRPGFRPDVKLAYVTLEEGQSIDISTGL